MRVPIRTPPLYGRDNGISPLILQILFKASVMPFVSATTRVSAFWRLPFFKCQANVFSLTELFPFPEEFLCNSPTKLYSSTHVRIVAIPCCDWPSVSHPQFWPLTPPLSFAACSLCINMEMISLGYWGSRYLHSERTKPPGKSGNKKPWNILVDGLSEKPMQACTEKLGHMGVVWRMDTKVLT